VHESGLKVCCGKARRGGGSGNGPNANAGLFRVGERSARIFGVGVSYVGLLTDLYCPLVCWLSLVVD